MATSGDTTFTMTRNELINDALLDLGALALGDSPTADQIAHAGRVFNRFVKGMQNRQIQVNKVTTSTVDTVADTASYALAAGTRRVLHAYINVDNTDIKLNLLSKVGYDNISNKTTSGVPTDLYISYGNGVPTIFTYPVATEAYTITYVNEAILQDFDSATDNPDFPTSALDMLFKGLRFELCSANGIPMDQKMVYKQEYDLALADYLANNGFRNGDEIVSPKGIV